MELLPVGRQDLHFSIEVYTSHLAVDEPGVDHVLQRQPKHLLRNIIILANDCGDGTVKCRDDAVPRLRVCKVVYDQHGVPVIEGLVIRNFDHLRGYRSECCADGLFDAIDGVFRLHYLIIRLEYSLA